jgi:hypothetical protein
MRVPFDSIFEGEVEQSQSLRQIRRRDPLRRENRSTIFLHRPISLGVLIAAFLLSLPAIRSKSEEALQGDGCWAGFVVASVTRSLVPCTLP